jgi:hypothetical protein
LDRHVPDYRGQEDVLGGQDPLCQALWIVSGKTCEPFTPPRSRRLPVLFEQCRAGGLAFIRRHDRSIFPWVIAESPWESVSDTELLWRQLMTGKAR